MRGGREGRGGKGTTIQRPPAAQAAHQGDLADLPPPPALAPRPLLPPHQLPPPLLPPHPLLPPPTMLLPFPLLMPIPIPIPIPIPFPKPCKCSGLPYQDLPLDDEESEPQPLVIDIKKEKGEEETEQQVSPSPQIPVLPKGTEVSLTPRTSKAPNKALVLSTRPLSNLASSATSPQITVQTATRTQNPQEQRRRSPALRQPPISGEEESRRKRRALIMDR